MKVPAASYQNVLERESQKLLIWAVAQTTDSKVIRMECEQLLGRNDLDDTIALFDGSTRVEDPVREHAGR